MYAVLHIMQESICSRTNFGGARHVRKTEVADKNLQDLIIDTKFFYDFGKHSWFVLLL